MTRGTVRRGQGDGRYHDRELPEGDRRAVAGVNAGQRIGNIRPASAAGIRHREQVLAAVRGEQYPLLLDATRDPADPQLGFIP